MPARKRKRRRPPQPRPRRREPTQNKLPPADSFNLKARSVSTWPFSLWHRHPACWANGRLARCPARAQPRFNAIVGWSGSQKIAHHPERIGARDLAFAQTLSSVCKIPHSGSDRRFCVIGNDSHFEPLNLLALSFRDQAAKIALWKLLDARFRSHN